VIVVTGATGVVGGAVARKLAARGEPIRLIVRDPARAPSLPGAEIAVATYDDPEALSAALEPGDRVFMVSMHAQYAERLLLHRSFVEVAAQRRVARVVYLSFIGAGPDASFVHARSHGATEAMLRESGLPWSAVRNGMYSDVIGSWFDPDGRITGPGGDGRVSFSYRPELSEAIALLLAEPAQDHREIVTITGPEAVSLSELAALATDVTGEPYRYEPLARDDWISYRRSLGRLDWAIEAGITYYDGVARGEADVVSNDYHELTGRSATPIGELIQLFQDDLPLRRGTGS
jgi:NAD(P)H dehydrogenase (quinone)